MPRSPNACPVFARFQDAFCCDGSLKQALAMVYDEILDLRCRTYAFFRKYNSRRHFPKLMFSGMACFLWFSLKWLRTTINGILASLPRHWDLVDKEASSIATIETRFWGGKQQEEIGRCRQLQHSFSWLLVKIQEDRLPARRQKGACQWVLSDHSLISRAENQDEESILWAKKYRCWYATSRGCNMSDTNIPKGKLCWLLIYPESPGEFRFYCCILLPFCNNHTDSKGPV